LYGCVFVRGAQAISSNEPPTNKQAMRIHPDTIIPTVTDNDGDAAPLLTVEELRDAVLADISQAENAEGLRTVIHQLIDSNFVRYKFLTPCVILQITEGHDDDDDDDDATAVAPPVPPRP